MEIKPMLCETLTDITTIDLNDYLVETKMDGERVVFAYGHLFNRRGIDITKNFPELKSDFNGKVDGEIVVVDDKLSRIERFSLIQSRTHLKDAFKIGLLVKKNNVRFMAFDLLEQNNEVITNYNIEQRKEMLSAAQFNNPFWIKIEYELGCEKITDVIMLSRETGEEGVILKKKGSLYENKRSDKWLKLKFKSCVILKFNQYEIQPKGLTLCSNEHSHRVVCNGMQSVEVKRMIDTKGYIMAEIEYLDLTPNGMYRQPTFKKIEAEV